MAGALRALGHRPRYPVHFDTRHSSWWGERPREPALARHNLCHESSSVASPRQLIHCGTLWQRADLGCTAKGMSKIPTAPGQTVLECAGRAPAATALCPGTINCETRKNKIRSPAGGSRISGIARFIPKRCRASLATAVQDAFSTDGNR